MASFVKASRVAAPEVRSGAVAAAPKVPLWVRFRGLFQRGEGGKAKKSSKLNSAVWATLSLTAGWAVMGLAVMVGMDLAGFPFGVDGFAGRVRDHGLWVAGLIVIGAVGWWQHPNSALWLAGRLLLVVQCLALWAGLMCLAWVAWDRAGLSYGMAGFEPWKAAHWATVRDRFLYGPALPGPSVVAFVVLGATGMGYALRLLFVDFVRGLSGKGWRRPPLALSVQWGLWLPVKVGRGLMWLWRRWMRWRAEKPQPRVGSERWARMRREARLAKRSGRPALPAVPMQAAASA